MTVAGTNLRRSAKCVRVLIYRSIIRKFKVNFRDLIGAPRCVLVSKLWIQLRYIEPDLICRLIKLINMIPIDFPEHDEIIYSSNNLIAVKSLAGILRSTTLVITFYPLCPVNDPNKPRKGQSRETIRAAGLDAIHVIPAGNHWYQYPDMDEVLFIIAKYAQGYDDLVLYGQSMGAYGAIHSSSILQPDRVLAICPQFSIDVLKITYKSRYETIAADLKFLRDDFERNVSTKSDIIIAYDPRFSPDKYHYLEISSRRNAVYPLLMPFCGHGVSEALKSAGLIPESLISLLINGQKEINKIRILFRGNRRRVPIYNRQRSEAMIERASAKGDAVTATMLSRRHIIENPSLLSLRVYCEIAEKHMGAEDAASRWLETIARLGDSCPAFPYVRAVIFLRKMGDLIAAKSACVQGLKQHPTDFGLCRENINNYITERDYDSARKLLSAFNSNFGAKASPVVQHMMTRLGNMPTVQ